MFNNADEAKRYVDQQLADAQKTAEQAQKMAQEMGAIRVRGTSDDRLVSVTVGQAGNVIDVEFAQPSGASAHQLRSAFMQANSRAQQELVQRIRGLSEEHYGKDSATARVMEEQYQSMFPPPPSTGNRTFGS